MGNEESKMSSLQKMIQSIYDPNVNARQREELKREFRRKIEIRNKEINQIKKKNTEITSQIQQKDKDIAELKRENDNQRQDLLRRHKEQIWKLQVNNSDINNRTFELECSRREIDRKNTQIQEEILMKQYLEREVLNSNHRIENLIEENLQLMTIRQTFGGECSQLRRQIEQLKEQHKIECNQLKRQKEQANMDRQTNTNYYVKEIESLKDLLLEKMSQIEQMTEQKQKRTNHLRYLFQHSIISKANQQKKNLINCLEVTMNAKLDSSKSVFSSSESKIMVLEDDFQFQPQKDYALIIKMQDESYVAAFSGFKRQYGEVDVKNVLMNLDKNKNFTIKNEINPALFTYQKPFLHFGNDDIRIKDSTLRLQSRFGSETSLFDPDGMKTTELFTNLPAKIIGYEIFQLFFEQNE